MTRRFYIGRHRVHHGALGVVLLVLGGALAWHDRLDRRFWLADFVGRP